MTENRKSIWGFVWTSFWLLVTASTTIATIRLFMGGSMTVMKHAIKTGTKYGNIAGGLLLVGNLMVAVTLILLMVKEHYLDEKPSLKLSPILVGGFVIAAGEYTVIRYVAKIENLLPLSWLIYVIIYCLYLYAHAFRPYRPIKMLSGV